MKNQPFTITVYLLVASMLLAISASSVAAANTNSGFPIEVSSDLHHLPVTVSRSATGNAGSVIISNHGDQAIRCSALFKAGPEGNHKKRVTIQPQKQAMLTHRAQRKMIKMRVELECLPVDDVEQSAEQAE